MSTAGKIPPVPIDECELVRKQLLTAAEWIQLHEPLTASRLRQLGDAVGPSHEGVDRWANVDLFAMFPVRAMARYCFRGSKFGSVRLWLERFRTFGFFTPLLVTWYFLYTSGGDLTVFLRDLPIGAVINVALFGMTMVVSLVLSGGYAAANTDEKEAQLQDILRAASLILSRLRNTLPIEYVQSMTKSGDGFVSKMQGLLEEFVRYKERLDGLTRSQEAQGKSVESLLTSTVGSISQLTTAVHSMTAMVGTMNSCVAAVQAEVKASHSVVEATKQAQLDTAKLMASAMDRNVQTTTAMATTIADLRASAGTMQAVLSAASPSLQATITAAEGLRNIHKAFLLELSRPLVKYEQAASAMESASRSMDAAVHNMLQGQQHLASVIRPMGESMQFMAQRLGTLDAALTRAVDGNSQLRQQMAFNETKISAAIETLVKALKELSTSAQRK